MAQKQQMPVLDSELAKTLSKETLIQKLKKAKLTLKVKPKVQPTELPETGKLPKFRLNSSANRKNVHEGSM
jgi:hypothetical protein